jgi:hypothetical protein
MDFAKRTADGLLYLTGLALAATLLYYSAILPNARRAERLERRAHVLEREVATTAEVVEQLRGEVRALQSDPYTIERTLKRRMKTLRPDRFEEPPPR